MMGKKIRGIRLFLDQTFEERRFASERNKAKYGKKNNTETSFEPVCVFSERRSWSKFKFWKNPRHLIFFVDEALSALRFGKAIDEIASMWTQDEIKTVVKKQMAKSLTEHKPLKWSQFIMLMIPIVAILILLVSIANRVGVF